MQVPEEMIQFVKNESNSTLRGKMIAKLIENPQATIDDLKKFSVVEKESWDIALFNLLKKYQLNGDLENYRLEDFAITSIVKKAKELNKNLGGQIKFESSFPTITLTVGNNVYIYDDTSREKSIASFLKKLHSLTGEYDWQTRETSLEYNSEAAGIKTGIIEVVKCNSRQDLIKYGAGETWCVCDPSTASHYITYKVNHNGTFYMVFDGLRNEDDPAKKVLITIGENNVVVEYADTRNDANNIQGYKNLEEYYEYLRSKKINTDQFVNDPMSEEERMILERVQYKNENTEWFKDLSTVAKAYYISMGYDLTNDQFDIVMEIDLPKSQKIMLDAYVHTGLSLPSYQLNKFNKGKFLDYRKTYEVSRKTYLDQKKQMYNLEKLIEFAVDTFDRELLVELYKENKLNDNQVSEMFTKFFEEDDQFCVRFGLELSEVLPKLNWLEVIQQKLENNSIDQNFEIKYKEQIEKFLPKIDWIKVVEQNLLNNTFDENFQNKYKQYINPVLPKINWIELNSEKERSKTLNLKFLKLKENYVTYLGKTSGLLRHVKYFLYNSQFDEFLEAFPDFAEKAVRFLVSFNEELDINIFQKNVLNFFGRYIEKYDVWYGWFLYGNMYYTIEDLILIAEEFKHTPNFVKALEKFTQGRTPTQN